MPNIKELISSISAALYQIKAYNLPSVCSDLGMSDGDSSDAYKSKRIYVERRLDNLPGETVIEIARKVLEEYPTVHLSNTFAEFTHDEFTLSLITRHNILDEVTSLDSQKIHGRLELIDFLKQLHTLNVFPIGNDDFSSVEGDIALHMGHLHDWDCNYLFEKRLGLLKIPDLRFFTFLEQLVHPIIRSPELQEEYVSILNKHLVKDRYQLIATEQISGTPVYRVVRIQDGVSDKVKNLIFAADGNKPEIVLEDSISNNIKIVKYESNCLVYDRAFPSKGLRWNDLVKWWQETQEVQTTFEKSQNNLYRRLIKSLSSAPEQLLFDTYFRRLKADYGVNLPALIPQVYLHYDPYTIKQLQGNQRLMRQRMDFLLLFSEHQRIVIEVDGKQHYSKGDMSNPQRYAEMVTEDRRLKLAGYEIYRFGGYELQGENGKNVVESFFRALFRKHEILAQNRVGG